MKNSYESWDVLGDSRKRYSGPWAEIGKYSPGKEPIRLQDLLPCPLKKIKINISLGKASKLQLGHAIVISCKIIIKLLSLKEIKNFTYTPVFVVHVPYNNAS